MLCNVCTCNRLHLHKIIKCNYFFTVLLTVAKYIFNLFNKNNKFTRFTFVKYTII